MLEIILLIVMGKRLGTILRAKGRRPGGYQFLMVIFWFGGEILGAVVGAGIAFLTHPDVEELPLAPIYLMALVGAILGMVSIFAIAKALRPVEPPAADGRDEYHRDWQQEPEARLPRGVSGPGDPHITDRPPQSPRGLDERIRE
jgi:hypothetical protein